MYKCLINSYLFWFCGFRYFSIGQTTILNSHTFSPILPVFTTFNISISQYLIHRINQFKLKELQLWSKSIIFNGDQNQSGSQSVQMVRAINMQEHSCPARTSMTLSWRCFSQNHLSKVVITTKYLGSIEWVLHKGQPEDPWKYWMNACLCDRFSYLAKHIGETGDA